MNPRRPLFPSPPGHASRVLAACAALAIGSRPTAVPAEGTAPVASVYDRTAAGRAAAPAVEADAAAAADEAARAERIVASSLARIGRAESVSIRLRQRVRLGDRVLVGAGRYLQAGRGDERRFRFETTLTSDGTSTGETFEVTEVSDGLYCWLHRRIGTEPPTLHRIDIRRIRSKLEELGAADPADTAPYVGGLQRNLWWARQWFRFTAATPAEHDGRPVWLVEGRWQPGTLELLLPALAESAGKAGGLRPEQLPDGVPWESRLAIGRGDLLPLRMAFLAIPGTRPVSPAPPEPIAEVEFLEVQLDQPVDAAAFFFQPASQELVDVTDHVVKTMSLMRP